MARLFTRLAGILLLGFVALPLPAVAKGSTVVWKRKGTPGLFAQIPSLTEIGRRILGDAEADFDLAPACRQLFSRRKWEPTAYERMVRVLAETPALHSLRAELEYRLQSYFDQYEGLGPYAFLIDFHTPSNRIVFVARHRSFDLDRPLSSFRLGWIGPSDPAWATPVSELEIQWTHEPGFTVGEPSDSEIALWQEQELAEGLAMFTRALKRFSRHLTDPEEWLGFFRSHHRFASRLQSCLAHPSPAVHEICLNYTRRLLERAPFPLNPQRIFVLPQFSELGTAGRLYVRIRRRLLAALAESRPLTLE